MSDKYFTDGRRERIHVSTREPDELTQFFANRFGQVIIRPHNPMALTGMEGTFVSMPGLKFDHSRITGGFDFMPVQKLDAMIFNFPISGQVSVVTKDSTIDDVEGSAICFHGAAPIQIKQFDGRKHCLVAVDAALLTSRLSVLLERPVTRSLQFAESLKPSFQDIRPLFQFVYAVAATEFGATVDVAPTVTTAIPDQIADLALMVWPNSFTEIIGAPTASPSPRQVKRAIDFIHSNLNGQVTANDVAAAAGVSVRSLQYSFRRFVGKGVAEYQRSVRLESAKNRLELEPERSIAEIGRACGYRNAAHFAKAFLFAYGVTPTAWRVSKRGRR